MPLNEEQIQLLLKKADKPKRRKGKSSIDDTQRDVMTWFKLAHKLVEEDGEKVRCSNPNCPDTRPIHMCVEIDGLNVCRRCFLDGYTLNPVDDIDD